MLKKQKVKVTKFDLCCMLVGRVLFWALITSALVGAGWLITKGIMYFFVNVWLNFAVTTRIGISACVLSVVALSLYIVYYTKYNIKVLDIEGHRVVLRKKIFNVF